MAAAGRLRLRPRRQGPAPCRACAPARSRRGLALDRGRREVRKHRRLLGPSVRRVVVPRQSSPPQPTRDERLDGRQDLLDIERRHVFQGMKPQRAAVDGREHAVEDERMEVQIEVERAPEALDHDDASGEAVADARAARAVPQPAKHRLREHGGHRATESVVPGEQVAEPVRQAQHPLAHRHVGQNLIDQVRGALRHAATATAWTQRAALAGEGDQPIEPTRATPKPREAARQPPALEKVPERSLDKRRQALAVAKLGGLRPKRLEMVANDLVQNRGFRGPWLVLGGGQRHGRRYPQGRCQFAGNRNRPKSSPVFKTLAESATRGSGELGVLPMAQADMDREATERTRDRRRSSRRGCSRSRGRRCAGTSLIRQWAAANCQALDVNSRSL
jgi:hypothetical protein